MSQSTNTAIVLKVKFMSSYTEGWDYMKGPAETLELEPTITLPELSDAIKAVFAIPDGKSHVFFMNNSRRPPFEHAYGDLEDCDVYRDERGVMLRNALVGNKFKYEYSAADSLLFQVTVVNE